MPRSGEGMGFSRYMATTHRAPKFRPSQEFDHDAVERLRRTRGVVGPTDAESALVPLGVGQAAQALLSAGSGGFAGEVPASCVGASETEATAE